MMKTVWAYMTLIRIPNCLLAMAAVGVGRYLTPGVTGEGMNPLALAAAFFVCGFGNIVNDICDIDSDRINHPRRALPSGIIIVDRAKTVAFCFLIVTGGLLFVLDNLSRLIVIVGLILVTWYNLRLKHKPYWGNAAVSLLGSLAFFLGGAGGGIETLAGLPGPMIPAVFAFLMHFGREIIKDVQDRVGDRSIGSRTAPVVSGTARPMSAAYAALFLLCGLAVAVYAAGWFKSIYLFIVIALICIPLSVIAFWLGLRPEAGKCRTASAIIKLQMAIGLAALILGKSY